VRLAVTVRGSCAAGWKSALAHEGTAEAATLMVRRFEYGCSVVVEGDWRERLGEVEWRDD
jgi:hypothetical protein